MINSKKIALTVLLYSSLFSSGFAEDIFKDMIFYAPLDGSYNAIMSKGNPKPSIQKNTPFVEGKFGQGVEFKNEKDVRLYYAGDKNFNITSGTISFWVKRKEKWRSKKAFSLFSAQVRAWNKSSIFIGVTRWNELSLAIWSDENYKYLMLGPNGVPYGNNTWYHVVATYTDGSAKLFFNAEEHIFKSSASCDPMMTTPSGTPKHIQFGSNYAGSTLNGVMDEIRIFNRVLSLDEIKTLYNYSPIN